MSTLQELQAQYANAIYQAARYTHEAEIAKSLLDAAALEAARGKFAAMVRELPAAESTVAETKGTE